MKKETPNSRRLKAAALCLVSLAAAVLQQYNTRRLTLLKLYRSNHENIFYEKIFVKRRGRRNKCGVRCSRMPTECVLPRRAQVCANAVRWRKMRFCLRKIIKQLTDFSRTDGKNLRESKTPRTWTAPCPRCFIRAGYWRFSRPRRSRGNGGRQRRAVCGRKQALQRPSFR